MTDAPTPPPKRKRKWLYPAVGVAIVASGAAVGIGPAAPYVVDYVADGARIWRLGALKVDGVHGGWLGALRADHVTIEDEEGVWIEASNVNLNWNPHEILFGQVQLNRARADSIIVHRQPRLLAPRPPQGANFDVRISDIHVETITVEEPVLGASAAFTADVAMDLRDKALHSLAVGLRRNDSNDDKATIVYQTGQLYALVVDVESLPGGILARALGVSEQGLRATAHGEGDATRGSARFDSAIGADPWITGASQWTTERWSADLQGRLDIVPSFADIARRIGPSVTARVTGDARRNITAHAETPFLAVDVTGALDEDDQLAGPAHFVATSSRLSDIARESPFEHGATRLEGELRRARGTTAVQGTLTANQNDILGRRVALSGPVQASLTDDRFHLAAQLSAPANSPALFANAALRTELTYDRRRHRFTLDEGNVAGDALALSARGWVNGEDGEFSGEWRSRRLGTLIDGLTGEAGGRWRAFAEDADGARVWTTAVEGAGSRVGGSPEVLAKLLGVAPQLDARLTYENGGITVAHARINGAQLRAASTGRIVQGNANLALEATARGPLSIGGAEIAGAVDATGQLTGRITRPTLTARASLSSFAAGGVVVEQPVVDFTLAPAGNAYAGRAQVQGAASGQPLNGSANVAIDDGTIALSNLDAQWGALQAQGSASFAPRGASAELDVNGGLDGIVLGVTGRLAGELSLTPDLLVLDAQIMDARSGDLRVRAATLHARGPMDAIAANFNLRGRLRQAPLAFEGTALLDTGNTTTLSVEGRGTLADADIFTRAPMRGTWSNGAREASLNVAVGDGVVQAAWTERGRSINGTAQIDDAPLAPLAAIWGERASGRIDGTISLASNGGGLAGNANVTLNDARFAGRQRGTLDMHIVGDLDPGRLQAVVDATSTEGLVAHFEADAPVVTSTEPIRIALVPERRGRAIWSVRGPAASLWAAARLPDQSLEGDLNGEGELAFGAGYLSGDGHIEIANGRFEDKLTGITLINLNARVAIDDRGVNIETFTAAGPRGGTLTATGGSANQRDGQIAVTINDMLVADRPDARARASGELTLAWQGLRSTLTGDLNIDEANVDIAANPEAGIPTLDVIEVNRSGEFDDEEEAQQTPTHTNASTELNVRIRAPGRVFTRGRGVDAEWSLDLRLQGTSRDPRLYGQARAVRGTLALSGQPFEIEDARIFFNGDPLDAQIDMTAVRDTADLTARIRLVGTARDPEVTFSSDPPLPEDEILPQVLFGRSVEDLSALEAAQLAASLAALSGRASLDIVDAARAAAGLDRFNVRQDEDGGFLVAGGVYLTRDVYVEVARTGLGQAQTRVEWTVRPRLVLITSFLSNGDQRVSLRWRRESD